MTAGSCYTETRRGENEKRERDREEQKLCRTKVRVAACAYVLVPLNIAQCVVGNARIHFSIRVQRNTRLCVGEHTCTPRVKTNRVKVTD